MTKHQRSIGSFRKELIAKSREAALTAIRVFNDPQVNFKSETFIVLMIIAWTYLLHAHYREKRIEYRYYRMGPKRRIFDHTKYGVYKYWELDRYLNDNASSIDKNAANNLRFLIGLRNEIEQNKGLSLTYKHFRICVSSRMRKSISNPLVRIRTGGFFWNFDQERRPVNNLERMR